MWRAFDAGLYHPTLLTALTLPEICAGLAKPLSEFVKRPDYEAFIDEYADTQKLGMDGERCFRLRGGLVHRGNAAGHPYFDSTHVIFTVPDSQSSVHNGFIRVGAEKAFLLDLKKVCGAIEGAVYEWFREHSANELVIENVDSLISWREDGLPPFVGGAPVVGSGPTQKP